MELKIQNAIEHCYIVKWALSVHINHSYFLTKRVCNKTEVASEIGPTCQSILKCSRVSGKNNTHHKYNFLPHKLISYWYRVNVVKRTVLKRIPLVIQPTIPTFACWNSESSLRIAEFLTLNQPRYVSDACRMLLNLFTRILPRYQLPALGIFLCFLHISTWIFEYYPFIITLLHFDTYVLDLIPCPSNSLNVDKYKIISIVFLLQSNVFLPPIILKWHKI